ncbi:MAG TPA: hypothetical protein VK541_21670 [Pedobacter sp.]|uniref:hypothetical protein n=1 Tax=Pedobacter sp. TaxID=1411316 RepID=UPI002D0C3DDC|nr:hypothetical protein [Pedobacter sp.]HMI05110.1 hypothetical protein [Pedobacter sp.]
MEQELNTKQQLAALMANPENIGREDEAMLNGLAEKYPYFQPLHLLLAKAVSAEAEQGTGLATAALYNSGQLLYQIIHSPENLSRTEFNVVSYATDAAVNEPESLDEAGIDEVDAEPEGQVDEQEIFEEIGEINIEDYRGEPEDDLVLENIVSTDFFAFQDNFKVEEVSGEVPQIEEYSEQAALEQETVISKYDDDKLPYTFLWWLAKTRKEHQQIFQPYASPKQHKTVQPGNPGGQSAPAELQQQYVENIFHMQSVFGDEENGEYVPSGFRRNSKGDEIIESFIKNEPQISPPKPEQINNENKARKSAEDHSDMVSETLAKIYIEQMLYDKAIETYEKLSLMFPEKSRYFADLIQSIEKKI